MKKKLLRFVLFVISCFVISTPSGNTRPCDAVKTCDGWTGWLALCYKITTRPPSDYIKHYCIYDGCFGCSGTKEFKYEDVNKC